MEDGSAVSVLGINGMSFTAYAPPYMLLLLGWDVMGVIVLPQNSVTEHGCHTAAVPVDSHAGCMLAFSADSAT
jgi:hypothetical protein